MRLPQKLFKIDTYLGPREAFHFVRKDLPERPPVFEHHHDHCELMLVGQGQVHHWINGVEERLEQGQMVFLRPQDSHALQAVLGTGGAF